MIIKIYLVFLKQCNMSIWQRPPSVKFPSIWHTFESKNVVNGFRRKFWIQDLTDEYRDDVLHNMTTGFLKQETLTKYSRLTDDPESVEGIRDMWKSMIEQKVTLICLTKDEDGTTRFVGCNVLGVSQKTDPETHTKGKTLNMVINVIHDIYGLKDLYGELKVDKYLNALGLYVSSDYRGEGIGAEIVKARRPLSLAVGLTTSVTIFSSIGGQRSAEKAGFKDIIVYPCKDLTKLNPSYVFPGIEEAPVKTMRVMYAKYDE